MAYFLLFAKTLISLQSPLSGLALGQAGLVFIGKGFASWQRGRDGGGAAQRHKLTEGKSWVPADQNGVGHSFYQQK